MKPAQLINSGALRAVFRDNAMFYKDITQWLRNRTFASMFFGLLLVAEGLSIFVIFISHQMASPGLTLFYGLYLVLLIYALLIAYQGNSLTAREFSNQTFELFELSGMSLERMVGGKLLSMLYQFFFGFFCLIPFMFFAYIVGGLDFLEMIVGIMLVALMAVPLYLLALATALTARLKQVTLLVKMASMLFVMAFAFSMIVSTFANEPMLRSMVRAFTELIGKAFGGDPGYALALLGLLIVYFQVCLLLFYLCCDNVSRENDSREMPVKVLTFTLIISWMLLIILPDYFISGSRHTVSNSDEFIIAVPVFLAILAVGLRGFYSTAQTPLIVQRRYQGAGALRRGFYWIFQPGIRGGFRTIVLLTAVSVVSMMALGVGWTPRTSLLVQIPWFFAFPFIFFAPFKELRRSPSNQRTLVVTCWVILGAMVIIGSAWTRSNLYNNSASATAVVLATVLSPLSSLSIVSSTDGTIEFVGKFVRLMSGITGLLLMVMLVRAAGRLEDEKLALDDRQAVASPSDAQAPALEEPSAADPIENE